MDYTLRPGERMIRYFHPADDQKYFLPWAYDGSSWREFPQEIETYKIKTSNGPRSQKDSRAWGTGRIEYRPPRFSGSNVVIDMPCPYVIIGATFTLDVKLPASESLTIETSTDFGHTWTQGARLTGPHDGLWRAEPATVAKSKNGTLNAVSGSYGYQVRFTSAQATITNLLLATEFQLNPRSIPQVTPRQNEFQFRSGTSQRTELPIRVDQYQTFAKSTINTEMVTDHGQSFIRNQAHGPAAVIFSVEAPGSEELAGFDAGGRFLDLRDGLAPDKLTAEVRRIAPWPAKTADVPAASISWSTALGGPWQPIWTYDPKLTWKDGDAIGRTLRWPEVQKKVRSIPAGVRRVYVRYSFQSMAIDDFRLAYVRSKLRPTSPVIVTHVWKENGAEQRHIERISPDKLAKSYHLEISDRAEIANEALIMECPSNVSQ